MNKIKNPYVIVGLLGLGIYVYKISKKKKKLIKKTTTKKEETKDEPLKPVVNTEKQQKTKNKITEMSAEEFADKFKIPVKFVLDTEKLTTKEKAEIVVANVETLNKQTKMTGDERQTLIRMVNYLEYKIEKEVKEKNGK